MILMEGDKSRACRQCGVEKPTSEFYGNVDKRSGRFYFHNYCKACSKQRADERRKLPGVQAKINARCRKQYHANLDESRAFNREKRRRLRAENPEASRAKKRARYRQNPEKYKEAAKEAYNSDLDRGRSICRRSYYKHREKRIIGARVSMARRKGAIGSFTLEEWKQCVLDAGERCKHCGQSGDYLSLTKDHIIPISRGGSNWISNIQPLCGPCNSRKKDRLESELAYLNGAVAA